MDGMPHFADDDQKVVTCALDNCLFSNGNLRSPETFEVLASEMNLRKELPVMIHANWMFGGTAKEVALRNAGLWLTNYTESNRKKRTACSEPTEFNRPVKRK